MRKLFIAALLAASAMPAQAFTIFEIRGTAAIYEQDPLGPPVFIGFGAFKATGALDFAITSQSDASGFGALYSSGPFGSFNFDFDFAGAPLPNYLDGILHAGSGFGVYGYSNGYSITTNYLTITSGSLIESAVAPSPFPSFSIFAPVPEPATWAFMIGGFAAAGAMMRRQRVTYRTVRATAAAPEA